MTAQANNQMPSTSEPLLSVQALKLGFQDAAGKVQGVVHDVDFEIDRGETLAIVGESGSGKSVTAMSMLQLMDSPPLQYLGGEIRWQGENLLAASEKRLQQIRGHQIGVIFQEPLTALNPLHRVQRQITEVIERHQGLSKAACRDLALEWLKKVGIRDPEKKLQAFPHQLSGGERQRVMIAMALVNQPDLLIADEPTTALDVTIQAQILKLIKSLQQELGMAVLFISHDLQVVSQLSDRVAVMKDGQLIEQGPTKSVLQAPQEDYTRMLVEAEPHGEPPAYDANQEPLLRVDNLRCWFPVRRGVFRRIDHYIKGVDGVSLEIRPGESLGLVGESGSGKSSLGRSILRLEESRGDIHFQGRQIDSLSTKDMKPLRREIQVVFQDPFGSLSPRMTVEEIIGEGLEIHQLGKRSSWGEQIDQAMREVDLDPALKHRYPNEFSGGQRQRICIARALVLKPRLLVLDEPTSALDRTIQQQVIELLQRLQKQLGLSYLFISHDLMVVRAMCHRVMVMKQGKVLESGSAETIYESPQHPYTQELLRTATLQGL